MFLNALCVCALLCVRMFVVKLVGYYYVLLLGNTMSSLFRRLET